LDVSFDAGVELVSEHGRRVVHVAHFRSENERRDRKFLDDVDDDGSVAAERRNELDGCVRLSQDVHGHVR